MTTPPPPPTFDAVSTALEIHCGTLNCHGNDARNMRLFGFYGVRLKDSDLTGFAPTSPEEIMANFESVISIEPERLSQVVRSGGAGAEKWIVLSKGRGREHHKGGTRLVPGDAADTCIMSWLTVGPGAPGINAAACKAAATVVPPDLPGSPWSPVPGPASNP
jgi:hypothetical protein